MKKSYSRPEVDCSPVSANLMQSVTASVGGGGNQNMFTAPKRRGELIPLLLVLFSLLPMSLFAWNYTANGNVLSAYGEGGYTTSNPLSITLNAPADLQFDGNYKPATISNTAAWEAAGLSVPTILYDGKTNAPSMLGTYTASISAGGATAEVVYTIKSVIDYQSFFHNGITQGTNYDVVPGSGSTTVPLNNTNQQGVWWDPVENCAVFDGQAYLQIDNPLGNVNANTGFTLTVDAYIDSRNNGNTYYYTAVNGGAYKKMNGWQRLFDLSDGNEQHCIYLNAGSSSHLGWCLRLNYNSLQAYTGNNSGKSYWNQWCTITLVVAPGGYTTLYVNGEMLTHSSAAQNSIISTVLNNIHNFNICYIGTSLFEAGGLNTDGFFIGKIRGFQTAEGALMPYYDGSSYHYLLSYETNGGNPITGTFEATMPNSLPIPTHANPAAVFNGWYLDEALTIPVTTGVALTKNTALYAKWNNSIEMAEGTVDAARWSLSSVSAPEGSTITVNYNGDLCPDGVMIRQKTAQTIYMNNDNRTTAANSYNATPYSRIELTGNLSAALTFTKEGVIDLKGHSTSEGFLFQHNEIGQTIIVKNGYLGWLDGNGGFNDYYKGTVVLENLTINNDVWTDGHAYVIKGGTYASIRNYKNSETPGTVTIYDGNFAYFTSNGGATYTLYGGHYTFNPISTGFCTIPTGYTLVDHGSGTYRYEVVCNGTPVLYPYDLTVTEVTPGREWTFIMPRINVEVDVDDIFCTAGTESDPYLIPSTEIWNFLARKVNSGKTYAGKYFRQTADITVSEMVGMPTNMFSGIYDGDGHTLTADITVPATGDWYNSSDVALFRDINGATIKNLHTDGTVFDSGGDYKYLAGIVGRAINYSTLINCRSSVEVKSSRNGDATNGGLVGNSIGTTIEGCVFDGKITSTNDLTTNCGGLVGWSDSNNPKTIVRNCLFAPTYFTPSLATGWSSTIGRDGGNSGNNYTVTNTYYTQAFGHIHQGKMVRSITAGTDVTVAPAGTATEYNVSGIASYGTGIKYDDVLYGGNGDAVSLSISHIDNPPTGYSFSHYSTNNGAFAGTDNPYTLTMANANAVISVNYSINQYTITFNSNGGSAVDPITQDYNTAITAPADPTRDYYTFAGWSPAIPATMPAEDIELTAQWIADVITLNESEENLTTTLSALYTDATPHDITITRSFVTGIYNTCCLPFSMSASEIAASPLAGAILKDYNGADVTGVGDERDLNIHLTELTEIVAGRPFLIKPETDIINPTFTGMTVTYSDAMGELLVRDHVDFRGILAPYDLAAYSNSSPDYLGVGMDGRLYWADGSKSTGPMRGFRAFFHVKDAGSSNNAPVRRGMHAQFVEDAQQTPTDVDQIVNRQSSNRKCLRDGQLLIEHNGRIYTITGQVIK